MPNDAMALVGRIFGIGQLRAGCFPTYDKMINVIVPFDLMIFSHHYFDYYDYRIKFETSYEMILSHIPLIHTLKTVRYYSSNIR